MFPASFLSKDLAPISRVNRVARAVFWALICLALLASLASLALFLRQVFFQKKLVRITRVNRTIFPAGFLFKDLARTTLRHSHCFSVKFPFKIFCRPHPRH